MKIAMVSMNAGPLAWLGGVDSGGQSVVVDCLSDALAVMGHHVTVYTQRDDEALPLCLTTAAGVHVHHIAAAAAGAPAAAQLAAAIETFGRRLLQAWSVDRPDIVHAHSWMSGKAALDAARQLDLPVVQTFHGLARAAAGRSDDKLAVAGRTAREKELLRACGRIIATSSAEVFALLEMGANPRAIKLVPTGVDLQLFRPGASNIGRRTAPFRAVTLGRLVPDAGVADVIEALRGLPAVELIVGGGRGSAADVLQDADARALAGRAESLGVRERVTFAGRIARDEVPTFLRSADVVVCTPRHDSIGTVALEAMACGVPVIVSSVGALMDAVTDGMTGLHVPPSAPRQLAYAIDALAADPAQRARFGRLGFERVAARYGWARIAAETFEVYTSVGRRESRVSESRA